MMPSVLGDLERLLDESLRILADPEAEFSRLQEWGARREIIFAGLKENDFALADGERDTAGSLIQKILLADAEIRAGVVEKLAVLGRKRAAARKIQKAISGESHIHSPLLLQRQV